MKRLAWMAFQAAIVIAVMWVYLEDIKPKDVPLGTIVFFAIILAFIATVIASKVIELLARLLSARHKRIGNVSGGSTGLSLPKTDKKIGF